MVVVLIKLPVNYNVLDWKERRDVRNQYVSVQNGKCYHCQQPLTIRPVQNRKIEWKAFPPNFLKNPIHLHHNHNTGMTIGAVHAYCNAVLWQYYGE